ncbi:TetR/AcrR family transcriptional regulator [Herbidospora mongoliensis]|uniref:TetR/AcrR family transcriptional regulator n=1 Tax=Herbidospora mongoliensis TaxID=688067 RepID=UPI0008317A58|nr:TetR/AcrR family transcriptional regulator [Herbidospora mongoliensis]
MIMPTPPWEKDKEPKRPARVPLTRARIIEAAFVVLDREGYHRISMRQVAAELGVAVSALYAHVENKSDLFRLMYTRMFDGHTLPDPDPANWAEQLKDFARNGRRRLSEHRDMAWISMAHVPFTPELLPHVERLVAIIRSSGMPDRVAAMAGDLLSTFLDGFTLEESVWAERWRESGETEWEQQRDEMSAYFRDLPPEQYPNMTAMAPYFADESNDYRFELGLEIIIRGLASYIDYPGGVQATVKTFDDETRSGSVYLDDGTEVPFPAEAFDAGPLRLLRPGQRVNIVLADGAITFITLSTFPVP